MKVNNKNSSGWTALQYAAYMGHHDTVATLISMGADTGVKTPRGYNPLTLASMCGNDPVIKLLAKVWFFYEVLKGKLYIKKI